MKQFYSLSLVTALFLTLGAPRALAQSGDINKINVLSYAPAVNPCGVLNVEPTCTPGHLEYALALGMGYAYNPLVISEGGDYLSSIVKHQLGADLTASVGIFERFEVGLHIPLVLYQTDGGNGTALASSDLSAFALGGIRFIPKVKLFTKRQRYGLNVAFIPQFSISAGLPTANSAEEDFAFEPKVVVDQRLSDKWMWSFNVGWRMRKRQELANLVVNDELTFALGGAYRVNDMIAVIGSLYGAIGFEEHNSEELPLEVLGGVKVDLGRGLFVQAALGAGITDGYGVPRVRFVTSVMYASRPKPCAKKIEDTDGDGILDNLDKCPTQAEDKDGFQDDDGCPDPDNDGDGVCDPNPAIQGNLDAYKGQCTGSDKAPNDPEDKDGFQDDDGVPDPDNDGDGVCDANETIQKNLKRYEKVCRGSDKAPDRAEDKDGHQDDDGAPDPDNDGDGVCDPNETIQKNLKDYKDVCKGKDGAPDDPEDKDGFQDDDGVPDPDNDGDGLCDNNPVIQKNLKRYEKVCKGTDLCPMKKETINGVKDDDGCPDKGKVKLVVTREKVIIMEKVYFDTGSDKIQKRSYNILDIVATTLKNHPWILKIRVEGHTDERGRDAKNLTLSKRRAASVKKYLMGKGIAADRLVSEGYGETRPIQKGCKKLRGYKNKRACWSKNRRVAFTILKTQPQN